MITQSQRPTPWLTQEVLLPFLVTRLGILLIALWAVSNLPANPEYPFGPHPGLELWTHWDGNYYLTIARDGYSYTPGVMSNVAFLPLYSLLLRIVTGFSHSTPVLIVAGILLSHLLTLAALILLYQLVAARFTPDMARWAVWSLLLFPTSYYLSMVYAESLFLLLTVGAFAAATRQKWWLVGLLGGFAAATRVTGIFLIIPLALAWWQQQPRRLKQGAWLLLIPAGLGGYMGYLAAAFGDAFLFSKAHTAWGRADSLLAMGTNLGALLHNPLAFLPTIGSRIDLAFMGMAFVLWLISLRRQPLDYTVAMLIAMALPIATFLLTSFPRHIIVTFPFFIALALLQKNRAVRWSIWILLALIQIFFLIRFSLNYWVA